MSTQLSPYVETLTSTNNAAYAASLTDAEKALPLPPGKKTTIITCMDARLHPSAFLGIKLGEAHIIRNAGGSAKDALRSLVISQQLLGTEEVLIIKHTGCGMLTFDNKGIHALVEKNLGANAKDIDFLPFSDLDTTVKEDVQLLKNSELVTQVSKENISGWVYDVESGKLRRVV